MKVVICQNIPSWKNNRICEDLNFAKSNAILWPPYLYKKLYDLGHELVTSDIAIRNIEQGIWDPSEVKIIQSYNAKSGAELIQLGCKPCILLLDESPLILFSVYDQIPKIINQFKYYYTFSCLDKLFRKQIQITSQYREFKVISYDKDDLKYLVNDEEISNWDQRKFLCLVAGNKYHTYNFFTWDNFKLNFFLHIKNFIVHILYKHFFSKTWKAIKNFELRTVRLDAVLFFLKHKTIDIYGSGWDNLNNLPKKYRVIGSDQYKNCIKGKLEYVAEDQHSLKINLLKQYKFNLCYENIALEGYVTEKIFHCFLTGTIPIFYGPKEIGDIIPKDAFIDVRDFKSLKDLYSFMNTIDNNKAKEYIMAGKNYLIGLVNDEMQYSPDYIANSYLRDLLVSE